MTTISYSSGEHYKTLLPVSAVLDYKGRVPLLIDVLGWSVDMKCDTGDDTSLLSTSLNGLPGRLEEFDGEIEVRLFVNSLNMMTGRWFGKMIRKVGGMNFKFSPKVRSLKLTLGKQTITFPGVVMSLDEATKLHHFDVKRIEKGESVVIMKFEVVKFNKKPWFTMEG